MSFHFIGKPVAYVHTPLSMTETQLFGPFKIANLCSSGVVYYSPIEVSAVEDKLITKV